MEGQLQISENGWIFPWEIDGAGFGKHSVV